MLRGGDAAKAVLTAQRGVSLVQGNASSRNLLESVISMLANLIIVLNIPVIILSPGVWTPWARLVLGWPSNIARSEKCKLYCEIGVSGSTRLPGSEGKTPVHGRWNLNRITAWSWKESKTIDLGVHTILSMLHCESDITYEPFSRTRKYNYYYLFQC